MCCLLVQQLLKLLVLCTKKADCNYHKWQYNYKRGSVDTTKWFQLYIVWLIKMICYQTYYKYAVKPICSLPLTFTQESISDFYWYYSGKDVIDEQGQKNFSKAINVAKQVFNTLTEYIQVWEEVLCVNPSQKVFSPVFTWIRNSRKIYCIIFVPVNVTGSLYW